LVPPPPSFRVFVLPFWRIGFGRSGMFDPGRQRNPRIWKIVRK
jgi:hypothetical protein